MNYRLPVILSLMFCLSSMMGCSWTEKRPAPQQFSRYQQEVKLGRAIKFRPRPFSPGGQDRTNHACLQGNYSHRYATQEGGRSREVWLCCVPVEELLRDSFNCSDDTLMPAIYTVRGADYAKIRSCHLQHPTSTEPTFIPACIPAPLQAPDLEAR